MKHVLFDVFGTLVSYSPSRVEQGFPLSYEVLKGHGATVEYTQFLSHWDKTFEEFESLASQNLREYSMDAVCAEFLARVLAGAPDRGAMLEFRDIYLKEWSAGVTYIPGVTELLADLAKEAVLILVTNTHHADLVHQHLRQMRASEHFAHVVTSVEHGQRKPSVAIFEDALRLAGATPAESIFVGDSFTADYQGARRAGLRCLLIDPERRHDVPESDRLSSVLQTRERLAG